ncbi:MULTISPECIES: DUF6756 family protein [unclassified Clostridium]|uniref:DUF6756 family protein n=1 Tax=unclassified Clostridium TaxID=2614128 RepID=UPI0002975F8C|nr:MULTISPECIES: DUF6756 family protein [unclassified Clostridium]EKQ50589.1 MAG: hypothetical protein A370_05594 [Clostridium sp. Maddingley MBC34-26]
MWNIYEEIKSAIGTLKIIVREVPEKEADEIVNNTITKYTKGSNDRYLWEGFINEVSVQDKDAWQWIDKFIDNSEAIMFFNPLDEKRAFLFSNGKDVVETLSETYGFEFYLTNRTLDYLLCFNHHDVLIANGSAKEWLEQYKR